MFIYTCQLNIQQKKCMYETLRFQKITPVYIYIYIYIYIYMHIYIIYMYINVAVNEIDINLCIISEYK